MNSWQNIWPAAAAAAAPPRCCPRCPWSCCGSPGGRAAGCQAVHTHTHTHTHKNKNTNMSWVVCKQMLSFVNLELESYSFQVLVQAEVGSCGHFKFFFNEIWHFKSFFRINFTWGRLLEYTGLECRLFLSWEKLHFELHCRTANPKWPELGTSGIFSFFQ